MARPKKINHETQSVRITTHSYHLILKIKDIYLEMGIGTKKTIHNYEIIEQALEFYYEFVKKLRDFAIKKR